MRMCLSPHDSRFFLRHSAHRRLAASAIRLRPSAEIFRRRWRAGRAGSDETLLVIGAVSPRDSSGKALRIAWRSAFNSASRACAPMNARWRMSTEFSGFRGLGIESVFRMRGQPIVPAFDESSKSLMAVCSAGGVPIGGYVSRCTSRGALSVRSPRNAACRR